MSKATTTWTSITANLGRSKPTTVPCNFPACQFAGYAEIKAVPLSESEQRVRYLEDRLRNIARVMDWEPLKRPAPFETQEAHRIIRGLCGGIS